MDRISKVVDRTPKEKDRLQMVDRISKVKDSLPKVLDRISKVKDSLQMVDRIFKVVDRTS
ncbi:hypothetical protein [Lysinibacillus cavernae]|uniref:hypothetical protein n=1 Tax=Lysinibacillus cavernae TaxID=2666135 RepID=UPI0018C2828F|nr:hypothetical protein [Lysinibacillus cavernae]